MYVDVQSLTAAAAFICVSYSVVVRRATFHNFWESATTACILLQGIGMLLIVPESNFLDEWLRRLTGQRYLADWAGHMCFVGAFAALALSAQMRLMTMDELRPQLRRHIQYPVTILVPITLMLLWHSKNASAEYETLLIVPDDGWLAAYRLVYCTIMGYILVYAWRLFWDVRRDNRSHTYANFYLVCIGLAMINCTIRVIAVFCNYDCDMLAAHVIWYGVCIFTGVMSLVAAHSWHMKELRHQRRQLF